uniref:I/LWEQ domain-containing protein n=1 Tax=Steinernema glaseri TaxID=37863 RepID=A0A1I8AQ08_9BILA
LVAVNKALNKVEAPLKQKHVRTLILGTHREKSANVFWNTVSRFQLEKNPVLTWKFCHCLHKLIRDGHRKVIEDSNRYSTRLVTLGSFWQHLRTSGYGASNTAYLKMLVSRLEFHKRNPSIPGNFNLNDSQLNVVLSADINDLYELAVELLDQMDDALTLQSNVHETLECLRFSSLVPQGQCLLAPLILVILDTSKLYDYLVKLLFKLHSSCPSDMLAGHRERFHVVFRKTKKFYEGANSLQYFKYLVSIPTLPAQPPNFLQAADFDSYRSPQAYLHGDGVSECDTPPDAQSLAEETLIDISAPDPIQVQHVQAMPTRDHRDDMIDQLRREREEAQSARDKLLAEARQRIEQYENRLVQMQHEIETQRQSAEDARDELSRVRMRSAQMASTMDLGAKSQEWEKKVAEKEEKFQKMKNVYGNLREEHIQALTEIGDLRKKLADQENQSMSHDDLVRQLKRKIEEAEREKSLVEDRAQQSTNSLDDLNSQLARCQIEIEDLHKAAEEAKEKHQAEIQALQIQTKSNLEGACQAALQMMESCLEDLQNVTTISFPPHLAHASLKHTVDTVTHFDASLPTEKLVQQVAYNVTTISFPPHLAHASLKHTVDTVTHFDASLPTEKLVQQCRLVADSAIAAFNAIKSNPETAQDHISELKSKLTELERLFEALPTSSGDIDLEAVGSQLEDEMKRMDAAIQAAVAAIEAMQRKARENHSGVRLEVNEKILDACNALMAAIMLLVARSRDVQVEIVAAGRGTASPTEFYKRNHQWTEGLLSAAQAVGVAAKVLVNSADGVVTGSGKFEHLIVAAQEIAASIAQLYVSSRVKADKDSQKLSELAAATKSVNTCTATVVATVKSGQQTLSDEKLLDFSHLSLHEAKKEEMESQVKMLELEQDLTKERAKLAQLRKQHYHMASLVAEQNANGNGNV